MYKTIVIDYTPKADEMAQKGHTLITFSITDSAKSILVFETSKT